LLLLEDLFSSSLLFRFSCEITFGGDWDLLFSFLRILLPEGLSFLLLRDGDLLDDLDWERPVLRLLLLLEGFSFLLLVDDDLLGDLRSRFSFSFKMTLGGDGDLARLPFPLRFLLDRDTSLERDDDDELL